MNEDFNNVAVNSMISDYMLALSSETPVCQKFPLKVSPMIIKPTDGFKLGQVAVKGKNALTINGQLTYFPQKQLSQKFIEENMQLEQISENYFDCIGYFNGPKLANNRLVFEKQPIVKYQDKNLIWHHGWNQQVNYYEFSPLFGAFNRKGEFVCEQLLANATGEMSKLQKWADENLLKNLAALTQLNPKLSRCTLQTNNLEKSI